MRGFREDALSFEDHSGDVIDSEEIRQNRVPDEEDDGASWRSGECGEDVAEKDLMDLEDFE